MSTIPRVNIGALKRWAHAMEVVPGSLRPVRTDGGHRIDFEIRPKESPCLCGLCCPSEPELALLSVDRVAVLEADA
jgi:hypothetical protein